MGDAIDGAMDAADDEEAASGVYSQICDEIGIQIGEDTQIKNDKIHNQQANAMVSDEFDFTLIARR